MAEARQIVLDLFRELDGFAMDKQMEVGLAGRPAVRMEAKWMYEGKAQRGIILLVDNPTFFNVVHFTSPAEEHIFGAGYPIFQKVLRSLKVIQLAGPMTVAEQEEDQESNPGVESESTRRREKVMRSPDLQLEIHYPLDWVYTLDEVNRAVVFSGPKNEPTWLTTVNFSVIDKWRG